MEVHLDVRLELFHFCIFLCIANHQLRTGPFSTALRVPRSCMSLNDRRVKKFLHCLTKSVISGESLDSPNWGNLSLIGSFPIVCMVGNVTSPSADGRLGAAGWRTLLASTGTALCSELSLALLPSVCPVAANSPPQSNRTPADLSQHTP